ncbi:MAG: aspartate 1-decarboxylase [Candidatus Micropelagos sp.]|uniref:Aspartate 1-decarboxylase n=1 Tax=PS1 clade bacterium TaxID=2175152 RepID=A0A368EKM9_9PROT|nr:aspartate 1-decarboxylase [Hyphomicrobiales bacterium]OUV49746.1 MAG: aspartate 1-decarboxylase [Alphaproteobacteria bacterium TMED110]RCL84268.1 MAG: aspartate 1-decarboxylase [PS1 clade bacterium]HCN32855.1 aspartate 1-decarboxylase [Rhodobiaceae bacterium]
MLLTLMKSKIHRARVTQCDMHYEGSITIDRDWLDEVGILPYEQVDVLNINTGARFTTYAIEAPRGSKTIGINGAAARLVQPDDLVIIISYIQIDPEAAKSHDPKVLTLTPR